MKLIVTKVIKQKLIDKYVGTKWIPKNKDNQIYWTITDIFISVLHGDVAVRVEKCHGGRNSPAIIPIRKFKNNFEIYVDSPKKQ